MRFGFVLPLALAFLAAYSARAAATDNSDPIAEAFAWSESNGGKVYRDRVAPHWLPDGHRFWYEVATGPDGAREFVSVDAATGELRRAATREALALPAVAAVRTSALPPHAPSLRTRRTGDSLSLEIANETLAPVRLFWVNGEGERHPYGEIPAGETRRRDTYEGHAWLVESAEGKTLAGFVADFSRPRVIVDGPAAGDAPPARHQISEDVSPDGRWRVEFSGDDVVLRALKPAAGATSPATAVTLTDDGNAERGYAGPVAWSPDSKSFVLTGVKRVPVRQITLVESAPRDQLQPRVRQIDYAKPGDPLPDPTPVLFTLGNVATEAAPTRESVQARAIDRALCPTFFTQDGRIDYRWSADGREFFFDYNQRGHQIYRILAVDAATASVRAVVDEIGDPFVDYTNKTWRHWLPGDRELLWISERDGFAHLWLVDVAGACAPRQLTHGAWVVRRVERVDAERGQVWFMAGGMREGEDPYHLHLCRVNLDGSGLVRLTEGDGMHRIEWSPDRRWFLDTWSRVDSPPVTELRRASDGALVTRLERADVSALLATGWLAPERFVAPGRDGRTPIHGIIVRPSDFDPSRRYPVVEEVYAGPQDAFAPKSFSTLGRMQALARLGFVVVQADGMGTNHRGRAFHRVAWKNLQDAGFPDRMAWLKAAAATRPWMDLARVGIYGGSAGGQSAMRALLDHGDFYSVAVADCGCHDNRMDKIWWNEQWLGWPLDGSYVAASNAEHAERLRGHLLLIVGEQDTNVDPASTLQVVDRLVRAGKPFEFLLLPGVGHGAAETPYGKRRRAEFLVRNLHP